MTLGENRRCVGVIQFIFYALLFYQLDPHNGTCLVLASLWWSINENRIEIQSSLDLVNWMCIICWFLNWIYRSSKLFSLLSVVSVFFTNINQSPCLMDGLSSQLHPYTPPNDYQFFYASYKPSLLKQPCIPKTILALPSFNRSHGLGEKGRWN